jgi:hypothetical protein
MAIEEPSKFAQLAAGLIAREALLTVAHKLPGGLAAKIGNFDAQRLRGHQAGNRQARFWNLS